MQVELVKWGSSSAVRLPPAVLKELNIALGDRLELRTQEGKIVLEPVRRDYRLIDMVAGITKQNRHTPADFPAPAGRESW